MALRTLLTLMFMVMALTAVQANETLVREYTYTAGESDSKLSARQKALQQLQTLVLEEMGVDVRAHFTQTTQIQDDKATQSAAMNYETQAQGIVKTQILEEQWNGKTFYLKASIEISDQATLTTPTLDLSTAQACQSVQQQVAARIAEFHLLPSRQQLVALAKQYGFNGLCRDWQYEIVEAFRQKKIINDDYLTFLFEQVQQADTAVKGNMLYRVLRYATHFRTLSDAEFDQVVAVVQTVKADDVRWVVDVLADATTKSMAYDEKAAVREQNEQRQWVSKLDWQLSVFMQMAQKGMLAKPDTMSTSQLAQAIIEKVAVKVPVFFIESYNRYHSFLDEEGNIEVADKLLAYIKRNTHAETLAMLATYINDVPYHKKTNTKIFKALLHIEKQAQENPAFTSALEQLVRANPQKIAYIVDGSSLPEKKRQRWIEAYQLENQFSS